MYDIQKHASTCLFTRSPRHGCSSNQFQMTTNAFFSLQMKPKKSVFAKRWTDWLFFTLSFWSMGTSSSKQTQPEGGAKTPAESEPDEEKRFSFSVIGNYADFTTTAVLKRYADPTCPVYRYDMTEMSVSRREIHGVRHAIYMLRWYHTFIALFCHNLSPFTKPVGQERIHRQRGSISCHPLSWGATEWS